MTIRLTREKRIEEKGRQRSNLDQFKFNRLMLGMKLLKPVSLQPLFSVSFLQVPKMITKPIKHYLSILLLFVTCTAFGEGIQYSGILIPDNSGKVMTVRGLIDPSLLGPTLMHEHLFLDISKLAKKPSQKKDIEHWERPFTAADRTATIPFKDYYLLSNVKDAVGEVRAYQKLGGKTIVDLTSIGLNRQPKKLREVAEKTNANIIASAGYHSNVFHPKGISNLSTEQLTFQMVKDIAKGMDGTNIKAGIIGEISNRDLSSNPKDSNELRVIRAAARASQLTGTSISFHSVFSQKEQLHLVLDILEEEGADLSRVVMGHVTSGGKKPMDIRLLESLLKRGVFLQFDYLGFQYPYNPIADMEAISTLIDYGYSNRIMVSHDVYIKPHLKKFGGYGFTFIHTRLLPYLRSKGASERAIKNIMEENPKRVLTLAKPKQL